MKIQKITLSLLLLIVSFSAQSANRFVTPSGAGTMDGSSWGNAAVGSSLQATIDACSPGDTVWVACGTYLPTTGNDPSVSFHMRNGVKVFGGFQGTETALSQRSINCGPCSILSGEINAPGLGDNSYTVVWNDELDTNAILDGFVIRDGNNDQTPSNSGHGTGGGMYNNGRSGGCHPVIRNCVFTNNQAYWGAGVFNNGYDQGNTEPTFINCVFHRNHAFNEGGGMDSYGVGGEASPILVNCIFSENTATNVGGMYNWGGNANGNANARLTNCVFVTNKALNGFAGAFIADNIDENQSTSSGSSTVTLTNCIVWNNTSTSGVPQFFVKGTAQVIATYSDIDLTGQSGAHVISGPGTGNVDTDPLFLNMPSGAGADSCWFTEDDGFRLQNSSPLINAGIHAGPLATDIVGATRNGNPEMGAYEFDPANGIADKGTTAYAIYPNPAAYQYTLTFADDFDHLVCIFDSHGNLVLEKTIRQQDNLVVSDWPAGFYFIRVDGASGNKLIKE